MNGKELLDQMALVDPAFVKEAEAPPPKRRRPMLKWIIPAACLCALLCTGSVLAATTDLGMRILQFFSKENGDFDYGYQLKVDVDRVPIDEFEGEMIREVPPQILERIQNAMPFDSQKPNTWYRRFSSRTEAMDYIGLKRLRSPELGLEAAYTMLGISGTYKDGLPQHIYVDSLYLLENNIMLQLHAAVYTEHWPDSGPIQTGLHGMDKMEFTERYYTTPSGKVCLMVGRSVSESGRKAITGYMVVDGIFYHCNISFQPEDVAEAKAWLCRWADLM